MTVATQWSMNWLRVPLRHESKGQTVIINVHNTRISSTLFHSHRSPSPLLFLLQHSSVQRITLSHSLQDVIIGRGVVLRNILVPSLAFGLSLRSFSVLAVW